MHPHAMLARRLNSFVRSVPPSFMPPHIYLVRELTSQLIFLARHAIIRSGGGDAGVPSPASTFLPVPAPRVPASSPYTRSIPRPRTLPRRWPCTTYNTGLDSFLQSHINQQRRFTIFHVPFSVPVPVEFQPSRSLPPLRSLQHADGCRYFPLRALEHNFSHRCQDYILNNSGDSMLPYHR